MPCAQVQLALLQSGNVLTAGGQNDTQFTMATAEVFSAKTRQWAGVGPMANPRTSHQVCLGPVAATFGRSQDVLIGPPAPRRLLHGCGRTSACARVMATSAVPRRLQAAHQAKPSVCVRAACR